MRSPTRRLQPSPAGTAGRTNVMQLELEQFANRLQQLRVAKGWSQSDLAREVWGVTENRAGRKVAKNRDRISTYEMGKSWPDPHNLIKIAEALGVTPEELAPDITASTVERQNPELAIVAVHGHPDKVHLKVNKLVVWHIATEIMQLLGRTISPNDKPDGGSSGGSGGKSSGGKSENGEPNEKAAESGRLNSPHQLRIAAASI